MTVDTGLRDARHAVGPPTKTFVRSPVALLRAVAWVAATAFTAARIDGARQLSFQSSLRDALANAPHWLVTGIVGGAQLAVLVPLALGVVALVFARRFRRLGRAFVAAVIAVAVLLFVSYVVGSGAFTLLPRHGPHDARTATQLARTSGYGIGSLFPTTLDLGVLTAALLLDSAQWHPRRRRWRYLPIAGLVVGRFGVGLAQPAVVLTTLFAAAVAAELAQFVLGVVNRRPRPEDVAAKLAGHGYDVRDVQRVGRRRTYDAFSVETADGRLFAKVLHRDGWAAFLPARLYRAVRFRDVGEQRPLRSLRAIVEHEALCAMKAHADGVPTPRLAVLSEFDGDAFLVAFDARRFTPLPELPRATRDESLYGQLWSAVAQLRAHRIVHRRLNRDAVLVDDTGAVAIVEYVDASLGVADEDLANDVAELLATSALDHGATRAVGMAIEALGADIVASALPRLQPLALTHSTRAAVRRDGLLDRLRTEVQHTTGVDDSTPADIERVKPRTLLMLTATAVALWTLVPQLAGATAVWSELRSARWWWVAAAAALSLGTYVGAAVSLDGSVREQLPFVRNVGVQLASSFVGVVAPGGVVLLTARYLRRRGVDGETAAGAVSLNLLGGAVVHVTLTVLFVGIAGTSGLRAFNLPSATVLWIIGAAVFAIAAAGALVPWSRAIVTTRVWPAVRRTFRGVGDVLRLRVKLIELIGGSALITMSYVAALVVSVLAFGSAPAFSAVALVYLVGSGIAAIAPTPGGIGAVEATLVAGLTSAGMPSSTAFASVLLFRLVTFWLPMLGGWLALVALQRAGEL